MFSPGTALHAHLLELWNTDAHVVRLGADHLLRVGVEDHDVRVRADGDRAFARVQAEQLCRGRGNELHETVGGEFSAVHAAGINQAEAVLDARASVLKLREIKFAHFFLFS